MSKASIDEVKASVTEFQDALMGDDQERLDTLRAVQAKKLAEDGEEAFVKTAYDNVRQTTHALDFAEAMAILSEGEESEQLPAIRKNRDLGFKLRDLCESYLGIEVKQ